MKRICLILLLPLLLGTGCEGKKDNKPASQPQPTMQNAPPSEAADPEAFGQEDERRTLKMENPEDNKIYIDKTGNTYTFLSAKSAAVFPVDFKIGILENINRYSAPAYLISNFLTKLKAGVIHQKSLNPENTVTISTYLKHNITRKNIPTDFRIGKITNENGISRCNIRLLKNKNSSEGEIYLTFQNNQWLITDIQVNLELLSRESETTDEKFRPSAYYWEIQQ